MHPFKYNTILHKGLLSVPLTGFSNKFRKSCQYCSNECILISRESSHIHCPNPGSFHCERHCPSTLRIKVTLCCLLDHLDMCCQASLLHLDVLALHSSRCATNVLKV
eukprot:2759794-Amphidinium_carterae.1